MARMTDVRSFRRVPGSPARRGEKTIALKFQERCAKQGPTFSVPVPQGQALKSRIATGSFIILKIMPGTGVKSKSCDICTISVYGSGGKVTVDSTV